VRTSGKQLQHSAAAASDVEKIANGRRYRKIEDCPMDGAIDVVVRVLQFVTTNNLSAQLVQSQSIALELFVVVRHEAEYLPDRAARSTGQAIEHPLPIPETLQQPGIAELLQLLRGPWLAQPDDFGQLGHAALALATQGDETHASLVSQGAQLQQQIPRLAFHKYIKINLYLRPIA
jgi:hypothetical protein